MNFDKKKLVIPGTLLLDLELSRGQPPAPCLQPHVLSRGQPPDPGDHPLYLTPVRLYLCALLVLGRMTAFGGKILG